MKLYEKEQLKNSRIFFDKRPPMFLTVFIFFTVFIILGALWFSSWMTKSYIVEAPGTITTHDNIYITPLAEGVITSLSVKEGAYVNSGDILFTVSSGSNGVETSAIENQIADNQTKINAIDKYINALNANSNTMSNSGVEQEYYEKVRYYLTILDDEKTSAENTQNSINKKEEQKKQKEQEIVDTKDQISKLTDSEEDELKKENLEATLESKNAELDALVEELEQLNYSSSSQAEQTRIQLIAEVAATRTSIESSLVELQGQLLAYNTQDNLTNIVASNEGYIHYLTPLKEGMSIQRGQTIAEISTNDQSYMLVEAYINASDISKVTIEDDVKVAIDGVNIQKYGTLPGTLVSIDAGTLTQETSNGNAVLYKCTVTLDIHSLNATDGTSIETIKSMPVTARIVYEEETYLQWLLELLSFSN